MIIFTRLAHLVLFHLAIVLIFHFIDVMFISIVFDYEFQLNLMTVDLLHLIFFDDLMLELECYQREWYLLYLFLLICL